MVTNEVKQQIEKVGYGKTGDIGGQPKQTYWTPDGRQIRVMVDMHEYARKNAQGKIIEQGIRDANLDNGWLLQKPTILKLYCPHCDRWHDTSAEINACGAKKKVFVGKHQKKASKELRQGDGDRITKLEGEISEIKDMFKKLLEAKG